ncbi:cache domain-containing protein [Methanolobus sediminis]|uniref:Cache domain-containing protein n=1 Tax=Methanolobus sediminis TaxID=3072978 RepID=A0AA51YM44_9EURY|nr:cache domain-containing protein [Methanolobus sediminis]WMW25619.1 cache domain-containing protein [Methanolobus sediminis]
MGDVKSFSVFDPSIRFEHREFYEEIISELNVIIPVCVQGKTIAVAISENTMEREQITELMKRVEDFSRQLLQITKKLFDQYYVAKEEQHESILLTTAYNKINTIDRNLLERTCDVRWWALETAFSDCISFYEKTKQKTISVLRILDENQSLSQVRDFENTGEQDVSFSLAVSDVDLKITDDLRKFPELLKDGAFKEFIGRFKHLCYKYQGEEKDQRVLEGFLQDLMDLDSKISFACDRLEDINTSYTLYRDLVITDSEGYIIANSNSLRRSEVLGLNVNDENWFTRALKTQNGTEYVAQDICSSKVEEQLSLVYSTAVRENSNERGNVLGTMGIFFDFQGETRIILDEYMPLTESGVIQDGCYSMFTSSDGKIIASTDEDILEVGKKAHIPRNNRALADGEQVNTYMAFEGVDSAIFSSRTDGYLEYRGLGWSSHVILPKSHIFAENIQEGGFNIQSRELMNSNINPDINKQTYAKIQNDKNDIQLISLNGTIYASKMGNRGDQLGPIFSQITHSSNFITSKMEELLQEMAAVELQLNLKTLENFAKQAIDLVDRNLFERAADIRWWSTDEYFWKALSYPSEEEFMKASDRLRVINGSYTMYRNLVLADSNGVIRACSNTELMDELSEFDVSEHIWFQEGARTSRSSQYAVQDVMDSPLEKDKPRSLIYAGGVREHGAREGKSIGVLGVMFDWDTEAKTILETCLPKDRKGDVISGSVAVYVNRDFEVIETTGEDDFSVGSILTLPVEVSALQSGEKVSGLFEFNDQKYIYGACRTKGYREYPGLNWVACVLRPISTGA